MGPEDIQEMETGASQQARSHDAWEPNWIASRFTALLRCNNPGCGHVVAVLGTVSFDENYATNPDGSWERDVLSFYTPTAFWEAPPIIRTCPECPGEVVDQLHRSFALYWLDHGACANAIRAAVEAILTERNVPTTMVNRDGKEVRISLHGRIEKFAASDSITAELLLVIKLLGNVGSHGDEVTKEDLLDAYDIVEHVIDTLYSTRAAQVAGIASELKARLSP